MNNSTPVPFLIAMSILFLCGYAVYRVGKKSTALGVTLGIFLIVVLVFVAVISSSFTVTLTGR